MVDIREQSPLAMAFVGDAVYSLLIREYLVTDKRHPINKNFPKKQSYTK